MNYYNPTTDTISPLPPGTPIGIDEGQWEENTSFNSGVQFAWDATSISLYKTCPRKYHYTLVKGYVPRVIPPPLAFGIHLHTLFQTWHELVESGTPKDVALMRVTRLAGLLGETLPPGDTARTKETLVRTIVWYLDQYWDDSAITVRRANGKPACEYHFQLPFMTHKGQTVYICGHIDRLVKWQGQTFVVDYKSTKYQLDNRFFEGFKPSIQIALYVTACHLIAGSTSDLPPAHGAIIDGIQLGVNFSRFARQIIPYSLEEVNEYIEDLQASIRQAMDASEAGIFIPNETACNNYSGCTFKEICSKPAARRETFLNGTFKQRTWDPLKPRT